MVHHTRCLTYSKTDNLFYIFHIRCTLKFTWKAGQISPINDRRHSSKNISSKNLMKKEVALELRYKIINNGALHNLQRSIVWERFGKVNFFQIIPTLIRAPPSKNLSELDKCVVDSYRSETIEDSLACATMVSAASVPVGRMEFVDPKSIAVINKYSGK
jgi:hypothetical protein